jgi:hypothetical protein
MPSMRRCRHGKASLKHHPLAAKERWEDEPKLKHTSIQNKIRVACKCNKQIYIA